MWTKWIRLTALALGAVFLLIVGALGAVIAFDSPATVPRLVTADTLPGVDSWNRADIPAVRHLMARDGAPLTYRLYPGRPDRAVVLVHGSSATSSSTHKLAQALQSAGATVYAISLRGHGGSGTTNGDTSYKSQLDDDLVDFVKAAGLRGTRIHRTLAGFSSGGGFVLRTASGQNHALFDDYLAISPYVAYDSPTERPARSGAASGGWASVALPRLLALSALEGMGLPWFQGLPVARFATDAKPDDNRTPVYSYRLLTGLQLGREWRAAITRIDQPAAIIVGANDELFVADQFQPLFAELNPRITVTVEPGVGHMAMSTDPRACAAVAKVWQRLVRFDFKVREDMFAGFDGDTAAFDRAMKLIDDTLAAKPDHAEALSWRGTGRFFMAGQAFARQAFSEGTTLASQGLADLDRALALQPDSISVRAARGPALLAYARGLRAFDRAAAERLTALAMEDFEFIVSAHKADWSGLAEHDRGELLGALAEGWLGMGDAKKADVYLGRMEKELPATPYAKNAALRRADPASKTPLTCLGCH